MEYIFLLFWNHPEVQNVGLEELGQIVFAVLKVYTLF